VDCLRHRSIYQVFDFRTSEAWTHRRQFLCLDRLIVSYFMQVQLEYVFASIYIRQWNVNLLVEPAWTDGRRV
jgi:hypothetical protein